MQIKKSAFNFNFNILSLQTAPTWKLRRFNPSPPEVIHVERIFIIKYQITLFKMPPQKYHFILKIFYVY